MFSSTIKICLLVISIFLIFIPSISDAQVGTREKGFEYHLISSTPLNHLYPGKILGVCSMDNEKSIVSTQIVKGELPQGISIFDDGTMAVSKVNGIEAGKHKIKVEFIDSHGNSFTEKIKIELLQAVNFEDVETSIRIAKPKFTHPQLSNHYEAGDIIAQFHDPDGKIRKVNLIKGSVPPGVMMVQNKKFIVSDPDKLKDGEYFCMFLLEDEKGGNAVIVASLPVGLQAHKLKFESQFSDIDVE